MDIKWGICVIQKSEFEKKYKIIGFDYLKNTVGSFWCEKHINITDIYLYPHLETDWLEEIVFHLQKELLDVLFVGVDFELELFARHKEFIERQTKCKVIEGQDNLKFWVDGTVTTTKTTLLLFLNIILLSHFEIENWKQKWRRHAIDWELVIGC